MIDRRTMFSEMGAVALSAGAALTATPPAAEATSPSPASRNVGPGTSTRTGVFRDPHGARARAFLLNDLSGDPDGLFATVHVLLCTFDDGNGVGHNAQQR